MEPSPKRNAGTHLGSSLSINFLNSGGQQNNASQPQQGGSLFGGNTSQPAQSGGLFGGANAPKPSGGLFGSSTTSQPQQTGSLFGNAASNTNQQSGSTGGGLFGSSIQQSQPQQTGSLFGGTLGQNQNATQGQQSGGSLFGNTAQNQNQSQGQQGGGLFGNLGQTQNQSQPQQSGGLFGGLGGNQNKAAGSSLFGNSSSQQPTQTQQPSLFGASVFNNSTNAPLAGSLTMGQQQNQQQTVPGTKIDISNIRPTTRFNDLHDDLKKTIETIDSFIKQQESYAAQCEALIPNHSQNVESVTPDVDLVTSKVETVELSLENDSRDISVAKDYVKNDVTDLARCIRVIDNLQLPSQFHYGQSLNGGGRARVAEDDYDVDLVGYFTRQAESMQKTLDTFTSNLSEIESHLRVIEATTVQQSQQVAAQRAGGVSGNDSVRELADTLRGFENGILDAAGYVGACREGVNELILGRVGNSRSGGGYRRY